MKHPSLRQLQDYFENEASSFNDKDMKEHAENCDRCSRILSEMAKVDIIFSKTKEVEVSLSIKEETLTKANVLLAKMRESKIAKVEKIERRREKVNTVITDINDLRKSALQELTMPALQAVAAMLVLGVVTEYARTSVEIEEYKILNDEVRVVYSELQGDINEDI